MLAQCERGDRQQLPVGITGSRGAASSVWSGKAATLTNDSCENEETQKKQLKSKSFLFVSVLKRDKRCMRQGIFSSGNYSKSLDYNSLSAAS